MLKYKYFSHNAIPTEGGREVLGRFPMPGRPTNLDNSRARAYCTCSRCEWGCFDILLSFVISLFFLPLCETARYTYRLKYCFKGPLKSNSEGARNGNCYMATVPWLIVLTALAICFNGPCFNGPCYRATRQVPALTALALTATRLYGNLLYGNLLYGNSAGARFNGPCFNGPCYMATRQVPATVIAIWRPSRG